MRAVFHIAAIAALLAGGASAFAADTQCPGVGIGDPSDLVLMRVSPGARLNFITDSSDKAGCPSASAACRRKGFLVAGDIVLANAVEGPFVCATFVNAKGDDTSGFLPGARLQPLPARPAPKAQDWAGAWKRTEAEIKLTAKGETVAADADATWGAGDPARVRNGGVHIGEFGGSARPVAARLAFGEKYDGAKAPDEMKSDECLVRLWLIGDYLMAEDNNNCGGANVSFLGVYRRSR